MGIGSNQNDVGYLKGRTRIVTDLKTGRDYVVEYNPDEDSPFVRGPQREVANPIVFDLNTRTGWQTMIDYPVSRDLVLNVWTESPEVSESDPTTGPSPFAIPPDFNGAGVPFGGATVVGRSEMGHLGVSRDVYFNACPGAMSRLGAAGETLRYEPQIYPKYFTTNDGGTYRTYTLPSGAPLSNVEFNNPSGRTGQLVFGSTPTQSDIISRRARSWAYTSTGTGYNDVRSRPARKFFGSVGPNTPGQAVRCPVAWNCANVEIVGNAVSALGATITFSLWFTPRNWDPARLAVGDYGIGPITAVPGIAIPLSDNIEWVFVEARTAIAPAALESLFELNYWLGT